MEFAGRITHAFQQHGYIDASRARELMDVMVTDAYGRVRNNRWLGGGPPSEKTARLGLIAAVATAVGLGIWVFAPGHPAPLASEEAHSMNEPGANPRAESVEPTLQSREVLNIGQVEREGTSRSEAGKPADDDHEADGRRSTSIPRLDGPAAFESRYRRAIPFDVFREIVDYEKGMSEGEKRAAYDRFVSCLSEGTVVGLRWERRNAQRNGSILCLLVDAVYEQLVELANQGGVDIAVKATTNTKPGLWVSSVRIGSDVRTIDLGRGGWVTEIRIQDSVLHDRALELSRQLEFTARQRQGGERVYWANGLSK